MGIHHEFTYVEVLRFERVLPEEGMALQHQHALLDLEHDLLG